MKLLNQVSNATHSSAAFTLKAGQTIDIEITAAATVDIQRKNGDSWVSLQQVTASNGYVSNGNTIVKLVVSSNTGIVNAEII